MQATQTLQQFTTWTVNSVPEREGVYQLFDSSRSLIYIGRSDNIRRRLSEHLNTSDTCIKSTAYFTYEVTARSVQREQELIEEYRRLHGRYPRCNDQGR